MSGSAAAGRPQQYEEAGEMELRVAIIDADAHVVDQQERAYRPYLPAEYRQRTGSFFPSFGWDIRMNGTLGKLEASEPSIYVEDMAQERIAVQVLYPSSALSIGLIREPEW